MPSLTWLLRLLGTGFGTLVTSTVEMAAGIAAVAVVAYIIWEICHTKVGIYFENVFSNMLRGAISAARPILTELEAEARPSILAFIEAARGAAAEVKADITGATEELGTSAFDLLRNELYKHSNVQPDQWDEIAGAAFGDAVTWGLASAAVTAIFESVFPEKLNALNSVGPLFEKMAGFEEITRSFMRPILGAAIGRPAQYDANSQFRSTKPTLGQGINMYARRKIPLSEFEMLQAWAGIDPAWEAQLNAIAFRPLNPRMLATALMDVPFPTATMRAILQDAGYSDVNLQFMLDVFKYNSTKNVRQQFVSALQNAYQHGVVSDVEFQDSLRQLGWSTEAINFSTQTAALHRRVTLATKVEQWVSPQLATGNMTEIQAQQQLEAAGVQSWYANLEVTIALSKAEIHRAKLEASAEAKLAAERQRAQVRGAIERFETGGLLSSTSGTTGPAGAVSSLTGIAAAAAVLAGELAAAGVDPIVVAATVATEVAKLAGKMRIVYGQILSHKDALVLQDRVNAIVEQMKKNLIGPNDAYHQLVQLGIDDPELNAIFARAAAEVGALTKHGLLVDPKQGPFG